MSDYRSEEIIKLTIRPEIAGDEHAIRNVNIEAFAGKVEADLIEKLRARRVYIFSLVAIYEGKISGHILFSPVTIESNRGFLPGLGLGPVAVLPSLQQLGIGSLLINTGIDQARQANHAFIALAWAS